MKFRTIPNGGGGGRRWWLPRSGLGGRERESELREKDKREKVEEEIKAYHFLFLFLILWLGWVELFFFRQPACPLATNIAEKHQYLQIVMHAINI